MNRRYSSIDIKEFFGAFMRNFNVQSHQIKNPTDLSKGLGSVYGFYFWITILNQESFWYRVREALSRASVQEEFGKTKKAKEQFIPIVNELELTFNELGSVAPHLLFVTSNLLPELAISEFADRIFEEHIKFMFGEFQGDTLENLKHDNSGLVTPNDTRIQEYAEIVRRTQSLLVEIESSLKIVESLFNKYHFFEDDPIEVPFGYIIKPRFNPN